MKGTKLHPAWKQALAVILQRGFKPGDTVTHKELCQFFGIKYEELETSSGARLAYLTNIDRLKLTLLEDYCIYLESVRGRGYRYVDPEEQTSVVIDRGAHLMRRALNATTRGITCIQLDVLTDEERRRNADVRAKFAELTAKNKSSLRKMRRLQALLGSASVET